MVNHNIGWDYSGCIGSPTKTSLKRLVEYKAGDQGQETWSGILDRFGRVYSETCETHGEDLALLDLYSNLAGLGVSKGDFREVAKLLLDEGLIRDGVIEAMTKLRKQGARNVIVTKNLAEEVAEFAAEVNERSGIEVISGVVGVRGQYDPSGRLVGVEELIGDYEGPLVSHAKGAGDNFLSTPRILKRDAVKRKIGNETLAGYVTDTGDKDIRETAETAVIIRSSVPYEHLDEYFKISADQGTGNYQLKVMNDGAWDVMVNDGKNLERDLLRALQES